MEERDEILATLERVWDSQGALFATFESDQDEEAYVQYLDGMLHVRWPFDGDAEDVLDEVGVDLPERAFVADEDPGHSIEIAVGDVLAPDIADFVISVFGLLLAPGSEVLASVEQGR